MLVGVIFALLSDRALAELPNQADLKAAYYIAALDEQIKLIRPASPPQVQQAKKQLINKLNADIKRMELYLLPRLSNIEPTGIIIAYQTAKADVEKSTNDLKACLLACGLYNFDCIEQCPSIDTDKHLESCNTTSFLPY